MILLPLKKSQHFKDVRNKGISWVASSFVLQMAPSGCQEIGTVRVGYVVTRKLGSAVVRNKAKRRLREITRRVFPTKACPAQDYVFIARKTLLTQDFRVLEKELVWALYHLHRISKKEESDGDGLCEKEE